MSGEKVGQKKKSAIFPPIGIGWGECTVCSKNPNDCASELLTAV